MTCLHDALSMLLGSKCEGGKKSIIMHRKNVVLTLIWYIDSQQGRQEFVRTGAAFNWDVACTA